MADQIRPAGPGKFATQVDAYVYELSQEGLNDEFTTNDGSWVGLLRADAATPLYDPSVPTKTTLNTAEQRFLNPKAGVIIEETGDGAISMDYFDTMAELDDAWEALLPRAEVANETDMDADPEMPELDQAVPVTDQMLQQAEDAGHQDATHGARRGSTPSMHRMSTWTSAWGYQEDIHTKELGLLIDAWRKGVYLYLAEHGEA